MAERQVVVIANPRSQNGALGRRWGELSRVIARELGAFDHRMTSAPGHATRLAREALADGADVVVAFGGDGTIHEVANGFFVDGEPVRPGAALGVLPYGTGGDFRRTARIPQDLGAAAALLRTGTARPIDVGVLEYRRGGRGGDPARCVFVNIASFGIGGLVDRIANESTKALGGKVSFFLATARAAVRYRNRRVRLTLDGRDDEALDLTINNVAVANGRYFGGGMHIAPGAALDDGLFEVVALGDLSLLDFVTSGHRVYKGTHVDLPKVTVRQARVVEAAPVDPDDEVLLDVDGEPLGALPATFTIRPHALLAILPEGAVPHV